MKKTLNFCRQQMRHLDPLLPNLCKFFLLTLLAIGSVGIELHGQPTKKAAINWNSSLHSNSEDWPVSIFMSKDCIHMYFAGWTITDEPYYCNGVQKDDETTTAIIGKFNTITQTLVWEKEYYIEKGNSAFTNVFEDGDFVWAIGTEHGCINSQTITVKVSAATGNPVSGFPILNNYNSSNLSQFNFNISPIIENGVITGRLGTGFGYNSNSETKGVLIKYNADGTVDNTFGTNGQYNLPGKGAIKGAIKFKDSNGNVRYAINGWSEDPIDGSYDVIAVVLDGSGNELTNWTGGKKFTEALLEQDQKYTDIDEGVEKSVCPTLNVETMDEDGFDIAQEGDFIYLGCHFDYPNITTECANNWPVGEAHKIADLAIIKVNYVTGVVASAVNVEFCEAIDFYSELEIKDGRIYMLGAKTSPNGQNKIITDGYLASFDLNLGNKESRTIESNWDINCSFDIAFDCDGNLIISGDNEVDNENYYFYIMSNGCQSYNNYGSSDEKVNRSLTQSETWPSSKKVGAKITVPSGMILTINNNAVIEFGASWDLIDYDKLSLNTTSDKTPKIVVESGGRLNLNNCTLRGMSACPTNSMWDGIEVQNGGIVTSNNAIIQDAKFGILADKGSYNSYGNLGGTETSGGAKLTLNGGQILNCRRGIHFASCPSNESTITGVEFICNGYLKDPSYKSYEANNQAPFSKTQKLGTSIFISANSVGNKIFINGGSVTNSAFLPVSLRGTGISQFKSQMDVFGTSFSNLNYAIFGNSTNSPRFMNISNGTFGSNYTGILFRGGTLHSVDNSTFNCTYPVVPGQNSVAGGIGVYNSGTTKTIFLENTFTAGANPAGTYGIISENTGSSSTTHKQNHYNSLLRGDQTQRLNPGLNLWCNDYTSTDKAWAINITTAGNGAFKDQGECKPERKLFPDNKFNDQCNSTLIHVHSNLGFTYWKHSSESLEPKILCSQNVTLKTINSSDCNLNALVTESGCDALIPIPGQNDDYYYDLVPTLQDGDQRQGIVNSLIRYYTGSNETERIYTLLQNESNENYKMSYAEILLDQGNISGAMGIVNSINSASPEYADFSTYFGVLVYARQNNLKLDQLPLAKIQLLEGISNNRTIGAYNSQAILTTYYGQNFPLIVETVSGLEYREKSNNNKNLHLPNSTLVPNPANNSVLINTNINSKFIRNVTVLSLEGKEMMHFDFKGLNTTEKIDVSQLVPGIYFVKINTNSGLDPELIKLVKE